MMALAPLGLASLVKLLNCGDWLRPWAWLHFDVCDIMDLEQLQGWKTNCGSPD